MARPKTYHIILTDDELKQLKFVIQKKAYITDCMMQMSDHY